MEELVIQGKKYISSKRAANITGYAKDYVGQLARQGKVPATRVGRSWYVDEQAILTHAGVKTEVKKNATSLIRPEPKSTTSLYSLHSGADKRNVLNTWTNIKYESEDSDLMPNIASNEEPKQEESKIQIRKSEVAREKPEGHDIEGVRVKQKSQKPQKPIEQPEKPKNRTTPLLLAPGVAVAIIGIMVAGWGIFMPSAWSINSDASQFTASVGDVANDAIFSYFTEIFNGGIMLIRQFLDILFGSLEYFFTLGLTFIINLF